MTDAAINKTIRLAGTNWDRRRKLRVEDVEEINRMYISGKSIRDIAKEFMVHPATIRYHVDEEFKHTLNKRRNDFAFSPPITSYKARVNYKREIANII